MMHLLVSQRGPDHAWNLESKLPGDGTITDDRLVSLSPEASCWSCNDRLDQSKHNTVVVSLQDHEGAPTGILYLRVMDQARSAKT